MAIAEVVLELLKGADSKRLNALSMASSGVHNASEIHMYARICNLLLGNRSDYSLSSAISDDN